MHTNYRLFVLIESDAVMLISSAGQQHGPEVDSGYPAHSHPPCGQMSHYQAAAAIRRDWLMVNALATISSAR
jgi:hypothetical protein